MERLGAEAGPGAVARGDWNRRGGGVADESAAAVEDVSGAGGGGEGELGTGGVGLSDQGAEAVGSVLA